jgi:hypothetical protein
MASMDVRDEFNGGWENDDHPGRRQPLYSRPITGRLRSPIPIKLQYNRQQLVDPVMITAFNF